MEVQFGDLTSNASMLDVIIMQLMSSRVGFDVHIKL